jgi:uncharacterized membrane protein SpoIIM required for sporulation/uncharacterized RDD family membrane protein YckC
MKDERQAHVITAERVPLTLPVAGLGERAIATLIDQLLLVLTGFALFFLYTVWGRGDLEADIRELTRPLLIALGVFFLFAVVGYDVICDLAFDGRTVGKRLTRLRVVDARGRSPDLVTSLLRNTLRLVDLIPFGYGVGIVTMFFTGTHRLGDLVANTIVISERARGRRAIDAVTDAAAGGTLRTPPAWSDVDVALAVDAVARTAGLAAGPAEVPCRNVLARLQVTPAPGAARATLAQGVLALAAADQGLAARLVRLARAEDAVRAALDNDAVADVKDAAARAAAAELMVATRRRVPPRHLESLSLALLDLERRRRVPPERIGPRLRRFFVDDVPGDVWRERGLIARAAAVFGAALVVGGVAAYVDVDVGRALVGDDLAPLIEQGAKWTDAIEREQTFAQTSVSIILNNVGVGVRAFALGVVGGVGALVVLVFNGLSLGAVFGYAASLDTAGTLLRFILAHGPVELSMITVAGAAGMCLGRALLSPGARSRTRALREEGRTGFRLLAFATTGFVVIGTVEGFVSPGQHFPVVVNASVGAVMWLLFFLWARSGARGARVVTSTSR